MPASEAEIRDLARAAGLDLPAAYFAQLVDAYHHLQPMLARLPAGGRCDEPAHVFAAARFAVPDPHG